MVLKDDMCSPPPTVNRSRSKSPFPAHLVKGNAQKKTADRSRSKSPFPFQVGNATPSTRTSSEAPSLKLTPKLILPDCLDDRVSTDDGESTSQGQCEYESHCDETASHISATDLDSHTSDVVDDADFATRVFLGDVDASWREQPHLMESTLTQFGHIVDFWIPRRQGCAFVTYSQNKEAEAAVLAIDGASFADLPFGIAFE